MLKTNSKFGNWLIPSLAVVLFILLPVLAYLQYNWIGELSIREKEHIRRTMENSAFQYSQKLSHTLQPLRQAFTMSDSDEYDVSKGKQIFSIISTWRKNPGSELLTKVFMTDSDAIDFYLFDEKSKTIIKSDLPESKNIDSANIRNYIRDFTWDLPGLVHGKFEMMIIPVGNSSEHKKFFVLLLDSKYIFESILKKNIENFFPSNSSLKIMFAIQSQSGDEIYLSNAEPGTKFNSEAFDIRMPIGMMFSGPGGRGKISQLRHRSHSDTDRAPSMFNADSMIAGLPLHLKPCKLLVGLKSGTLEQETNSIRMRNMIISFSILLILALVNIIIIIVSTRSKKLANQQMQFVAGISHELRTPLTVIRSAGANLSDGIISEPDRARKYGALILEETDKLWDMIETTLMFAGIQSNKKVFNYTNVNVQALIEGIVDGLSNIIVAREIEIKLNLDPNLEITVVESAMVSALHNLIVNSVKFNKQGGSISIEAMASGDEQITIIIEDTGRGIHHKDLPHIFEPFYRTKDVIEENISGNGIGMALVKNIIQAHNGKISVESKFGIGTKFIIQLPVKTK